VLHKFHDREVQDVDSGISSDPTVSQNNASSPFQQVRKDFAALGKALRPGRTDTAQSASDAAVGPAADAAGAAADKSGQQDGSNQLSSALTLRHFRVPAVRVTSQEPRKAFAALQYGHAADRRQTQSGQQTQKAHYHHHHHGSSAPESQNTTTNPFSDLAAIGSALTQVVQMPHQGQSGLCDIAGKTWGGDQQRVEHNRHSRHGPYGTLARPSVG